ncbi:MAG: flavin-containing monooxygenase [Ilumatobacteraceae bacterium]
MADHCIVGAGPGGIAAARGFLANGLSIDVFERHTSIGGIWDQANPGSPMYDSAHFISSRHESGYLGHPMPDSYPDYPNHRQILAYVREVADASGVVPHVRLGVGVERVERAPGGRWLVRLSNGDERTYRTITCATGTQWHPSMPKIPGSFDGTVIHSSQYRSASMFEGRRVLVIGAGNSGVDIACDAAQRAGHAAISVRRGYHLVPKHIFGMPADVFASSGPELPMRVAQAVFPRVLKVVAGDPTKYGWPKPDHKLFETHPIVNDQIVHHLRHGDLAVRSDVRRFDGDVVEFVDGTRESFEVVVAATGYRTDVPYLDRSYFRWKGNRPSLYLRLWSQDHDGLAAIGFTEGDGGAYGLFDNMGDAIARSAKMLVEDRASYERFRARRRGTDPDVSGGVRHVDSDRHAAYVHLPAYRKQMDRLRRELGWPTTAELGGQYAR